MAWILLKIPDGMLAPSRSIDQVIDQWSDSQVEEAAQEVNNEMITSEPTFEFYEGLIEMLKEFLPQPIRDAL